MESDAVIRTELLALLHGGNAHMSFDDAVADFPIEAINTHAPHVSYTPWHLLEHLRITQWDILEFIRNPAHRSPDWPGGYWPATGEQADPVAWDATIRKFRADLQALEDMVKDPNLPLTKPIPHAPGYTIFREMVLVGDHNAYHIGEFAILRQVMGTWPAGREDS